MGKNFKVGDVLICKDPNEKKYIYTRGEDYIGIVVDTSDDGNIKLKTIVDTKIINKGAMYWVDPKYFKLKDDKIEKAENF